ncbi:hypothetical protein GCM10009551_093490 [Nocardiopsis tropica]
MQVYDAATSSLISRLVGAILGRKVHVVAGDWRGVVYGVDGEPRAQPASVWIFDPSTMGCDPTVDLATFTRLLPTQAMLDAVCAAEFDQWLARSGNSRLEPAECAPVMPPQLVTGEVSATRADMAMPIADYLIYCGKALRVMKDLGLQSGDPVPPDFGERINRI